MGEVVVFVDDCVRGTLPALCVKEGRPTGDTLKVSRSVGNGSGLGLAWLLVLAGPLGWLGLFVFGLLRSPADRLGAVLPFSATAYQRLVVARRMLRVWVALTAVLSFTAIVLLGFRTVTTEAMAVLVGMFSLTAFVLLCMASRRLSYARVGLMLDASRRWVTLSGVHPDFAAAAAAQVDRAARATEGSGLL
jgi:hypothetical protein